MKPSQQRRSPRRHFQQSGDPYPSRPATHDSSLVWWFAAAVAGAVLFAVVLVTQ